MTFQHVVVALLEFRIEALFRPFGGVFGSLGYFHVEGNPLLQNNLFIEHVNGTGNGYIYIFVRTKAIHFENFLKFTKTHMSVEVKGGVCGLVSADKYKFIALSDYDKNGRFRGVGSRGG